MKWILLILSVFTFHFCHAQDTIKTKNKWLVNGYIKNLESLTWDKNFENSLSGNLIHQRLNVKWEPTEKLTFVAEFRNRLFWGEEVKSIPDFAQQLRNENDQVNLQKAWIQNKSLVLHTNVERLNMEYRANHWKLRLGRQRINWGIATTWNPNDIFNTYNFLDFDYEERPGVDGGRFQYFFNNSFNTELAFAPAGNGGDQVAALKCNLNKWGYDLQWITGWYKNQITLGAGWAGNIKDAGFKGEGQYFFRGMDTADHFNLALEGDYMFQKGWYLNAGLLFTNHHAPPVSNWNLIHFNLSPENLMPTKWNFIVTTSKEITPLFSVNMSVLYAPDLHLVFLLPSLKYNLAANLDADLIWQSFFAELNNHFEGVSHRAYFRLKWSF